MLVFIFSTSYGILQGVLFSGSDCIKTPMDFVRLWLHEASRVYGDKLVDEKDIAMFEKIKFDTAKATFEVRYLDSHHKF